MSYLGNNHLDQIIFKIIYTSIKWIPISNSFLWIFLFFKLIGFLMLTHDLNRSSDNSLHQSTVTDFFRNFCYFKDLKSLDNLLLINYNILCIIIYLIILIPFFTFYFVYKSIENNKIQNPPKLSKIQKLLVKFSGSLFILTHFLFQHLIEILSFIYLVTFVNSNKNSENYINNIPQIILENFKTFEDFLYFDKFFYCVLNTIFLIMINISLFFYFKFLNQPFFYSSYSFKFIHNNPLVYSMILSFNLQALQSFNLAFINSNQIKLYFSLISLIFSIFIILSFSFKYTFNVTGLNLGLFFIFLGFYASIINLIIYYTIESYLTNSQMYMKLSIEVLFSIFSIILLFRLKKNYYKNKIELFIFKKHKNMDQSTIYAFIEYFYNCLNDPKNFIEFFNIIYSHQNKCKIENCPCGKFRYMDYQKVISESVLLENSRDDIKMKRFSQYFSDFLLLCESEIVNTLHQINKDKSNTEFSLLILYFDFTFYFKRNPNFANFLIEDFLNTRKNIPFIFKYYFYTYKRKIIKYSKELIMTVKYSKEYNYMKFLNYERILENLENLILDSIDNFTQFINIKMRHSDYTKTKIISESMQNYSKIDYIFNKSHKLNENYEKIIKLIKNNFYKNPLKNVEACYKLTEYFKIIGQNIPIEISIYFNKVNSYYDTLKDYSVYLDRHMHHPIIIVMDKHENYLIKYISQKLCDYLNYKKNELIDRDFHIFLPQEFMNEHKVLVYKTIYLQKYNSFVKNTFMLTKDNYYYSCEITFVLIPSLVDKLRFILNIKPKNIKTEYKSNHFDLILDESTNFICLSKNFENHFGFNKEMLKYFKLNFSYLFNVDFNKNNKNIENCIEEIKKIELESLENVSKIFKYFDLEKSMKSVRNIKDIAIYPITKFKNLEVKRLISIEKRKDKILPILMKIRKLAEDSELNQEWVNIITKLEKVYYRYHTIYKLNSMKFISGQKIKKSFNYFQIKSAICNIGNIPYYYTRIYDSPVEKMPIKIVRDYFINDAYSGINNLSKISFIKNNNNINKNKFDVSISESNKNNKNIESRNQTFQTFLSGNLNISEDYSPINNTMIKGLNNNFKVSDLNIKNRFNHNIQLDSKNNIEIHSPTFTINTNNNLISTTNNNNISQNLMSINNNNKNNSTFSKLKWQNKSKSRKYKKETKKSSKKEKIILTLIVLLLIVLIGLSIINFLLKSNQFKNSQIFTNINFYNMRAKGSLFFASSLVLLGCTKVDSIDKNEYDTLELSNADLSLLFREYSQDLMYNFYNFDYYMRQTSEGIEIENKRNIKLDYKLLYKDWSTFFRYNSTINDEMKLYHFYISSLEDLNNFNKCRVKEFFIDKVYLNTNFNNNLENNKSSYAETILFYIIQNVFKYMRTSFDEIAFSSNNLMTNHLKENQFIATIFNIIILIVAITLILNFYLLFKNYKNKLKLLMDKFYLDYSKEFSFKSNLESFKNIIKNFDRKECENHEKNKLNVEKNLGISNGYRSVRKVEDKLIKYKRKNNISSQLKKNIHDNKSVMTNISQVGLINNSMNTFNDVSALTPKSFNKNFNLPESNQLYNDNIQLKKNPIKNYLYDEEDINNNNNNIQDELKISLLKSGKIILISSFFIFMIIVLTNSLINIKEIDDLILSSEISINFIERITRLSGLALYFKLSVIENNPNFIINPQSNYKNSEYGNYFNINFDFKSDSIYTILEDSEFAHIHYKLFLNIQNINQFMNDNKYDYILPNLRKFENSMRTQKEFCLNLAKEFVSHKTSENLLNMFEMLNQEVNLCQKFGDEIRLYGINQVIELIVTSLRNLYLDFFFDKNHPKDLIKHLSQPKLIQIFNGINIIFRKLQHNYINIIEKDMINLYDSIISTEFYFSLSLLLFNFLFVAIIFIFFIIKFETYNTEIKIAIKMYRKATK